LPRGSDTKSTKHRRLNDGSRAAHPVGGEPINIDYRSPATWPGKRDPPHKKGGNKKKKKKTNNKKDRPDQQHVITRRSNLKVKDERAQGRRRSRSERLDRTTIAPGNGQNVGPNGKTTNLGGRARKSAGGVRIYQQRRQKRKTLLRQNISQSRANATRSLDPKRRSKKCLRKPRSSPPAETGVSRHGAAGPQIEGE